MSSQGLTFLALWSFIQEIIQPNSHEPTSQKLDAESIKTLTVMSRLLGMWKNLLNADKFMLQKTGETSLQKLFLMIINFYEWVLRSSPVSSAFSDLHEWAKLLQ